jgi:hypothetical protein
MKLNTWVFMAVAAIFGATSPAIGKTQPDSPKKSPEPARNENTTQEIGKSYSRLLPEQRRLVDDYIGHYNETTGSKVIPQEAYDNARLSVRTTFDSVTHALLKAKLTDVSGKNLGLAIDLVEAVDEVMGEESTAGGDRQFRIYVYLKPDAIDILAKSREFYRDRDNSVYHKGFPISYRLKNGPPSIQFSISRDTKMADVDVDYRSSGFPKGLLNGHLTASNSDVRAGNNLDKHDQRWAGLNGWWREVFGILGSGGKPPKEAPAERLSKIPVNPAIKANQGIDKSAHDFLNSWVVDKQPNLSAAYLSRRSYPCLEAITKKNQKPAAPGMIRLSVVTAMNQFNEATGAVGSVRDVFAPADQWLPELKETKNAYGSEFRLISVPSDVGEDVECAAAVDNGEGKQSSEKYYGTSFRTKQEGSGHKTMSLLWAQESGYWKIIAIHIEDSSDAGILPKLAAAAAPTEDESKSIAGDPDMVKTISDFYQTWIIKRQSAEASKFASQRSYECLGSSSKGEENLEPPKRMALALDRVLKRVATGSNLSNLMSSVQPVNDLLRPVEQADYQAFAIMAVPDQKAESFLCQNRHLPEKAPQLKPDEATYGAYYLSASRLNFGEEQSPALLLLWTKEQTGWKIVAWAVEVP